MSAPAPGFADLRHALARHRVLAIVRGTDAAAAVDAVCALAAAGIALVEVSLTTPDAFTVLARARAEVDAPLVLGAGTVITSDDAERAVEAGATFLVSPGLGPSVEAAGQLGVDMLAGALTPTEVIAARSAGAAAIKLFPAGAFGPGYLRALREPLPDAALVPVGGVDASNAAAYFEAGALAIGVGSSLVGTAASAGGDLAALGARASELLKVLEGC
jgi:2-dehydro-3-deoxyphosphogluconate aldolase/(4S)-4-hydroxy-2-oxoglutarate aldolase